MRDYANSAIVLSFHNRCINEKYAIWKTVCFFLIHKKPTARLTESDHEFGCQEQSHVRYAYCVGQPIIRFAGHIKG